MDGATLASMGWPRFNGLGPSRTSRGTIFVQKLMRMPFRREGYIGARQGVTSTPSPSVKRGELCIDLGTTW